MREYNATLTTLVSQQQGQLDLHRRNRDAIIGWASFIERRGKST